MMRKAFFATTILLSIIVLITISTSGSASAKDDKGLTGWEIGSSYNKLYNPKERDSLKGRVARFKTVKPMPGMAPGTAFILEESDDEKTLIHLCPASYAKSGETGIRKGDKVKVKGSWVEIDGEDIFIASKVKKGDYFEFKVRLTSDGTPFWTMGPEQLAKEKKGGAK